MAAWHRLQSGWWGHNLGRPPAPPPPPPPPQLHLVAALPSAILACSALFYAQQRVLPWEMTQMSLQGPFFWQSSAVQVRLKKALVAVGVVAPRPRRGEFKQPLLQ